jgi:nitrogen regulatory protein PII
MITIVDRGKADKVTHILNEQNIHYHFVSLGHGTASSDILDYLGIGETEKDLVISVIPEYKVPAAFNALSEKMKLKYPGMGIAFTLPLSGISSLFIKALHQENQSNLESEVSKMDNHAKYSLVLVITNQGYTDQVMAAARSAGATGGTVLNSRGVGHEDAEKFLGISIQSEKEIVLIVCAREDKQNIMEAICREAGLKMPARGLIFSIPVESMIGLR